MSPDGVTPTLLRGAVAPLEVEEEGGAQRVAAPALHQRVAAPHEETPPAEAAATPAAVQHEEEMPAAEAAAIHVGVTQAVLEESAFLPCHLYTMHDYLAQSHRPYKSNFQRLHSNGSKTCNAIVLKMPTITMHQSARLSPSRNYLNVATGTSRSASS